MKEEQQRDLVKPWRPDEHTSDYAEIQDKDVNLQPYDPSRGIKVYVDQEKEEKAYREESGVPPESG